MLVITRADYQLAKTIDAFQRAGATEIVACPLFSIQHTPFAWPESITYVAFTSAAAVQAVGGPPAPHLQAVCVGVATAQAATAAGWSVALYGGSDGIEMTRLMAAQLPPAPVLHVHGPKVADAWYQVAEDAGFAVQARQVYTTCPVDALSAAVMAALAGDKPCIVPLFSPESAKLFFKLIQNDTEHYHVYKHTYLAISPATKNCIPSTCPHTCVAERPSLAGLVAAYQAVSTDIPA